MSAPQVESPSNNNKSTSDEPIQYRAVSGLAILALLLGIGSAAAMLGPVLWVVPILAIITALVAMRRIRSSEDLAGWNVAFLGLLLALLFVVAGPARAMSRQYWLASRAEQFSRQYFAFLQENKPHAAHQLRQRPGVRKPLTGDLPKAYENDPESKKDFDKFIAEEPAKSLLERGEEAKIERQGTDFIARDDRTDLISVGYYIVPGSGQKPMGVVTVVKRIVDLSSGRETWQIENVSLK